MKILKLVVCISILASSAYALAGGLKSYRGTAERYNDDSSSFIGIELQGIRMEAIENALAQCHNSGNAYCVLKNTVLTHNTVKSGYRVAGYAALVQEVDTLVQVGIMMAGNTVSEQSTWTSYNSNGYNGLSLEGIRADALNEALVECYAQEYDMCAIVSSDLLGVNSWNGDSYESSAYATVQGLFIDLSNVNIDDID